MRGRTKLTVGVVALFGVAVSPVILNLSTDARAAEPSACNTTFYANGTPITIAAGDGGGTKITWDGGGICEYTAAQANGLAVYGGSNDNYTGQESEKTSASITMTGGTVAYLNGGGSKNSYVTTADINITGGTIKWFLSVGGSEFLVTPGANEAEKLATAGDLSTARNVVEKGTLTVGAGVNNTVTGTFPNIFPIIYTGGDNAFTHVGTLVVNLEGGDWGRVVAGGSAGYVGSETVNISGGTYHTVQGLNRGRTVNAEFNISGGEIGTLYAGADAAVADGIGSLDGVTLNITGSAEIDEVRIGYQADADLPSTNAELNLAVGTVGAVYGFEEDTVSFYFPITIDGDSYLVEMGKTLADLMAADLSPAPLPNIKTRAGYTFAGFVDVAGEVFAETTAINSEIELTTKWAQVAVDNPQTADAVAIYAAMGVVGVLGIGIFATMIRKRVI